MVINMEKNANKNLKKPTNLLVVGTSFALFVLVIFVSYKLFGVKETYSVTCPGNSCWRCENSSGTLTRWAASKPNNSCTTVAVSNCASFSCPSSSSSGNTNTNTNTSAPVVDNSGKCSGSSYCGGCKNGSTCWDCATGTPRFRISSTNPNKSNCSATKPSNCGSSCTGVQEIYVTVTFNGNGGTVSGSSSWSTRVSSGSSVYAPSSVKNTNGECTFQGWEYKTEFPVSFPRIVNSDMTFTARWSCIGSNVVSRCYDCGTLTPRYRWSTANPDTKNCSVASSYTSESTCTSHNNDGTQYRCYDCGTLTPRYRWSRSNPDSKNCSVASSYTSESTCTSHNNDGTQYRCWDCEGTTPRFTWAKSNPNSKKCLVSKSYTTQTECTSHNSDSAPAYRCWECRYGNSQDVSYAKWATTNPKSGDNNWLCAKTTKAEEDCAVSSALDSSYTETVNAKKCYTGNGTWVNVTTCMPKATGARCKLSDGSTVLRASLTNGYGCDDDDGTTPTPTPSGDDDNGGGGGTTPTPSGDDDCGDGVTNCIPITTPTNPSAAFSDTINGDRCYNGTWVRVMTCQPTSVSGAQCKLKDGTLVLRSNITLSSGCQDISEAYTDVIDDYRCNKDSGKWIYISACQPANTGAKCKTSDSTILRSSITNGSGCSSSQPGGPSNGNEGVTNPQTGTTEMIVAFAIGIIALGVSAYYYRKNKILDIKG